jgi:hypothetical protein
MNTRDHRRPSDFASVTWTRPTSPHALIAEGLGFVAFQALLLAHLTTGPGLRLLRLLHRGCGCCRREWFP